jgi:hypothetical protein
MTTGLDPVARELLAAVVQLDQRTRQASPFARDDALALAGDMLRAVVDRQMSPAIGLAVLRAWRPGPAFDGGVLVTRPHDWPH